MDKLNLPIIRNAIPEPRPLSMKEYLEFVIFNLSYVFDKDSGREQKKALFVNVPFHCRDIDNEPGS